MHPILLQIHRMLLDGAHVSTIVFPEREDRFWEAEEPVEIPQFGTLSWKTMTVGCGGSVAAVADEETTASGTLVGVDDFVSDARRVMVISDVFHGFVATFSSRIWTSR